MYSVNRIMARLCVRANRLLACLLLSAFCLWPSTVRADVGCGDSEVFAIDNRYARADFEQDGYVNGSDLDIFIACATAPTILYNPAALPQPLPGCTLTPDGGYIAADFDKDRDVDSDDFAVFQRCWSVSLPADPNCGG